MIDAGLLALLTANNGGDAIDNYVAGKVFCGAAAPDLLQMPCITYSFVGGSSDPGLTTAGPIRQRVELNALAIQPGTNLAPRDIAGVIRGAIIRRLNGWQQRLTDGTNVLNAYLLNPGTDFVTEERVFRCMCEFYVLYTLSPS